MSVDHAGLIGVVFVSVTAAACLGLLRLYPRVHGDSRRVGRRLRGLAVIDKTDRGKGGGLARSVLARVGRALAPGDAGRRARLTTRLARAGRYGGHAPTAYLGAQAVLMAGLPAAALVLYVAGLMRSQTALTVGAMAAAAGMVLPGLWLDRLTRQRQARFRRGLPDALDMIVLCLEGGVSLSAALPRVTDELELAHPELAAEFNIVLREMQLGLTAGEALKKAADRSGLEDLTNLATVLLQSERYGAGVAKALRLHADACRQERQQRAEETAQKATVKILFPTLLCIFPAIFIVILGPAAYQIAHMLSTMK
jgi:tight adherence protein C